jgi:matrixin
MMAVRSTRTAVVAAVAALVAALVMPLQPAAAASGTYAVTLTTSTPVVPYGGQATFRAAVTSGGAPASSVGVELSRTGPDGTAQLVGYATTDGAGIATFDSDEPTGHSTYVATAEFDDHSAPVAVDVAYVIQPLDQTSFFAPTLVSPVALPPGGRITLSGRIAPAGSTASLTVEQRFGTGPWQPLGTAPVAADGTFTIPLGARAKVGTWAVRATHPAEGALVAGGAQATARVTVTGIGKKSAWRPIAGTKSAPARWGTCKIGYRVNPRRMPPAGLADLHEAMRRITQASGIRFHYLGRTATVPSARYGGPGRNKIVVAWAPPAKSGGLLAPGIGGVGGTSRTSNRLLSGYLLINSAYSTTGDTGFGSGMPNGLVLMHELGHVVGLNHSPDQRQIMAPGSPLRAAVWGAADLTGLRKVGSRCR